MNSSKIVCFGEILLRMSPALGGQWLQQGKMPVYAGGAELNVACALANWGLPVSYCTVMPDHYLGREMADYIREKGVDTAPVQWMGNRIGVYYLPQGSDLQHTGVIYDRAHSSFAGLRAGMIDWDAVLHGAGWFHFSAITPALNAHVAAVCKEALEAATRKGLTISVDLNYRPKLWQYGAKPTTVMPDLAAHCQVIMGNIWAAESLLGIPVDKDVQTQGGKQGYLDHSLRTSEAIADRFPLCQSVAHTFRFERPEEGLRYFATLFKREEVDTADDIGTPASTFTVSKELFTPMVVDKVGSGDCFMGGLIYGISQEWPSERIINFAGAAAFGKLQEHGDSTRQTVQQVSAIIDKYAQH